MHDSILLQASLDAIEHKLMIFVKVVPCCQAPYMQKSQSNVAVQDSEIWNMLLLVVLYMIQGVPLGLTMGAM